MAVYQIFVCYFTAHEHHLPGFIIQRIIVLVVEETVDVGKRPVDELLLHPVIPLRIFHKVWCGRQRSHQSKQTVSYRKLLDSLLNFGIRFLAHPHTSDIDGIQHDPLILGQRIIDTRLRSFCGREVQSVILCRPPLCIVTQITLFYIIHYTISFPRNQSPFQILLKNLSPIESLAAAFSPFPLEHQAAFFVFF